MGHIVSSPEDYIRLYLFIEILSHGSDSVDRDVAMVVTKLACLLTLLPREAVLCPTADGRSAFVASPSYVLQVEMDVSDLNHLQGLPWVLVLVDLIVESVDKIVIL